MTAVMPRKQELPGSLEALRLQDFRHRQENHQPHCGPYDGWFSLEAHVVDKGLFLSVEEHGPKSRKRTMVSLDAETCRRFLEWLRANFESPQASDPKEM